MVIPITLASAKLARVRGEPSLLGPDPANSAGDSVPQCGRSCQVRDPVPGSYLLLFNPLPSQRRWHEVPVITCGICLILVTQWCGSVARDDLDELVALHAEVTRLGAHIEHLADLMRERVIPLRQLWSARVRKAPYEDESPQNLGHSDGCVVGTIHRVWSDPSGAIVFDGERFGPFGIPLRDGIRHAEVSSIVAFRFQD